jgi:hypothetical protein
MKLRTVTFCCLAFLLAPIAAFAVSNGDLMVKPGTPGAARVISRLEQARHVDRMNSRSYTGGQDSAVGIFYSNKSKEIDSILVRLHEGKTVSAEAVGRALDNSGVARYGASLY